MFCSCFVWSGSPQKPNVAPKEAAVLSLFEVWIFLVYNLVPELFVYRDLQYFYKPIKKRPEAKNGEPYDYSITSRETIKKNNIF